MPTLYEIFTGRWGAEKDARIAELETASTADHAAWETERGKAHERITELEAANAELHQTITRDTERITGLETDLAPFRAYVAREAQKRPQRGTGPTAR